MCHFICSRAHALPSNSDFSLSLLFQCRFLYVVAQVIKNKTPQITLSWITLTPAWVFNRVETFTPTAPASLSNVSRNKSSSNSYSFRGNSRTVETHLNWVCSVLPFSQPLATHFHLLFCQYCCSWNWMMKSWTSQNKTSPHPPSDSFQFPPLFPLVMWL